MKRVFLVLMFFLIFTSFVSLNAQWAKTYRGGDHDWAKCIQQTNDGGYIVAGKTFPEGSGDSDLFLLKLSSAGNIEWWRTYGGSDNDSAECIQQIGDGGYIVAGFSRSFGLDPLGFWLLKLSSNGDIEWQRIYRGDVSNFAKYIQQTNDGGYIIAGNTFHCDPYCTTLFLIIKFSSSGDIEWQRTYGTGNEWAYSIQQTSDGGYIVEGTTYFSDEYMADILILKLSSAGDIEWHYSYVESGYENDVYSIQIIGDGGYIVAGSTKIYGPDHYSDILILKLSSSGDIEWQRTYGGSHNDWVESVQETSDGGFVIAGYIPYCVADGMKIDCYDDILVLELSSNGDINSLCELIGSSNATVSDSYLTPQEINITVQNTNIIPYDTNITPQDIEATEILLCLVGD